MKATVQARLDPDARRTLAFLVNELGWSPSKVVREGLRLLANSNPSAKRRWIVGLGKFASGLPDLASNKKHLQGFGR